MSGNDNTTTNNPQSQVPQHDYEVALQQAAAESSHKRAALAGQWRTPPLPSFPKPRTVAPAAYGATVTTGAAPATTEKILPPIPQVNVSHLPGSAEDYAKALQEAYLRGAEAAAAMAAGMTTAVSCPDFSEKVERNVVSSVTHAPVNINHNTNPLGMKTAAAVPPKPPMVHVAPPPTSTTTTTTAPITTATTTATTLVPNPLPVEPPAPPHTLSSHAGVAAAKSQPPSRSMSLPDMTTYAAQQEEEKRQKRLARNRASARLRRLRKKNLVDAYEQEVGILEKTLEQLKAHEWGESDNANALAEALSMDRGQQVLDLSERQKEAAALLEQQLDWVNMLEDIMMEDYVLHQVVSNPTRNPELQELATALQLSPTQMRQVEESKSGWQDEWDALQTVKASLVAMQQNEWLWNESVGAVAEQFMSILHKNQISKFLLWADHNAEAIDELDGVHASQGVPSGPIFAFGVESQADGSHDDEK